MNVTEMLEQSHLKIIQVLDGLPEVAWEMPGVCGDWSVKDIVAHLSSYELVLISVLNVVSGQEPGASTRTFLPGSAEFNSVEVEARKYNTAQQVEDEYQQAQIQSFSLLAQLPSQTIEQPGTLSRLNTDRSLADFVRMVCEHSREHCEQIARFRESSRVKELADE